MCSINISFWQRMFQWFFQTGWNYVIWIKRIKTISQGSSPSGRLLLCRIDWRLLSHLLIARQRWFSTWTSIGFIESTTLRRPKPLLSEWFWNHPKDLQSLLHTFIKNISGNRLLRCLEFEINFGQMTRRWTGS